MFIIIWKVAGELVSLKNITIGSKSPSGVRKAAFHSSPFWMQMLLYPQCMSNLVKRVQPARWSMVWGMSGEMFRFFWVQRLTGWLSPTGHGVVATLSLLGDLGYLG